MQTLTPYVLRSLLSVWGFVSLCDQNVCCGCSKTSDDRCLNTTCECSSFNEHYECGIPCDRTCVTLNKSCPIKTIKCVKRCYCDSGYARDKFGICITIKDC